MERHKCPHCGGDVLVAVVVMHPREMGDHTPVHPESPSIVQGGVIQGTIEETTLTVAPQLPTDQAEWDRVAGLVATALRKYDNREERH